MNFFAYFIWDPSPGMFDFNIPFLNRPVLWYGFLFAFGFFVGYLVLLYLLKRYFLLNTQFCKTNLKDQVKSTAERLTFYVILGAIIGSRLGDVLFYQSFSEIVRHPLSIIAIWQGGSPHIGGQRGY